MRAACMRSAVLGLALVIAAGGCSKEDAPAAKPASVSATGSGPNIVLISVDTLRRDHLGCYGYSRATSPRIDQLAGEGALFENTISSSSWTLPAHAAMFTGLSDSVHGAVETTQALIEARVTLAERLKVLGYATVGFFSGPLLHPSYGFGQGFDTYVDCTSYPELNARSPETDAAVAAQVKQASQTDITNPRVYEHVKRWLNERHGRPFFMFVHLWDVHADYIPPPPYDRMFDPVYAGALDSRNVLTNPAINSAMSKRDLQHLIALYDGEIAWTDLHVGKILDDLDALKLRERTIVMLVSDHGDEFFEHGSKGHRHTLFGELIRIPLIIRYPGHIPPGGRFSEQARMIDILPTVLELVGAPPATDVMGQSLAPLFSGGTLAQDTLAISELFSLGAQLRSSCRPDRKLISDLSTGAVTIFDLRADPGEHAPIRDVSSAIAQAARGDMAEGTRWLTEFRNAVRQGTATPQLPERTRQQLESLGYIDAKDHPGSK